jgi:hypothetical protein
MPEPDNEAVHPVSPEPEPGVAPDKRPGGFVFGVALLTIAVMTALIAVGGSPATDGLPDSLPAGDSGLDWSIGVTPEARLRLESLLATPEGFAVMSGPSAEGSDLWFSRDGISWSASRLSSVQSGIVGDGESLVAFREYSSVRLDWDGRRWVEQTPNELPTFTRVGYLSGRPALVVADGGLLVHSVEGELYYSPDGERFELVIERGEWWDPSDDLWERFTSPAQPHGCLPPFEGSLDYPPLLATSGGLVAFVPLNKLGINLTWPVCDPQLWVSATGRDWFPIAAASGFEPGSFVYDVAGRPGMYLAVGGRGRDEPVVWESPDGRIWSEHEWSPAAADVSLTDVVVGELGFVILGRDFGSLRRHAWFSPDGACWHSFPDYVQGEAVAVGADRIVLADRGRPDSRPRLWVGTGDPRVLDSCEPVAIP